jgi:calcineurin-like phosphoesterase family protein
MIYITSDLHFGHDNVITFCPTFRNYESANEMNEALIEYHNKTVHSDDDVYMLGDVVFGKGVTSNDAIAIIRRLNGTKHIILGNHDKAIKDIPIELRHELKMVFHGTEYYFKHGETIICMNHFPKITWNGKRYGSVHFYGHLHDKQTDIRHALNVCWDNHGRYLTIDEAIFLAKKREKDVFNGEFD